MIRSSQIRYEFIARDAQEAMAASLTTEKTMASRCLMEDVVATVAMFTSSQLRACRTFMSSAERISKETMGKRVSLKNRTARTDETFILVCPWGQKCTRSSEALGLGSRLGPVERQEQEETKSRLR